MKCFLVLLFVSVTIQSVKSANILAIFPFPAKSHVNILHTLTKSLLERGHEVDVVGLFPIKTNSSGYRYFSIDGSQYVLTGKVSIDQFRTFSASFLLRKFAPSLMKNLLNATAFNELQLSTKKYDLLLVHLLAIDCVLGFSHYFDIPTVGVITSVNLPWTSDFVGLPDNPSYIPNYFSTYSQEMTFLQRFSNTILYVFTKFSYMQSLPNSKNIAERLLGNNAPKIDDLFSKMSLILSNSHFSINQPRPVVPNFIEIGGMHIGGNMSLPKDIEDFLNSDRSDVIYVSFGSMIRTETFEPEKLQAMFQTFAELPYRVLWKGNKSNFPTFLEIPENIHFLPWMPQLGILCHPRTKLFISHGGLFSTQEAVYCGKPILGIPISLDQGTNIKSMKEKGISAQIDYDNITKELFLSAVKKLLGNKYKNKAEHLSKLFKDRPMPPLDTAIYWIEYVINHKGAPHLKSMSAKLYWYQYYLVDVICTFIAIMLVICVIIYKIAFKLSYILYGWIPKKDEYINNLLQKCYMCKTVVNSSKIKNN